MRACYRYLVEREMQLSFVSESPPKLPSLSLSSLSPLSLSPLSSPPLLSLSLSLLVTHTVSLMHNFCNPCAQLTYKIYFILENE